MAGSHAALNLAAYIHFDTAVVYALLKTKNYYYLFLCYITFCDIPQRLSPCLYMAHNPSIVCRTFQDHA